MARDRSGKEYERIVSMIYSEFADTAIVEKDAKIVGKSGVKRQIDVKLTITIDGQEDVTIIECKDYCGQRKRAGIERVDELIGKLDDVGADRGVLVSDGGFTRGACRRAAADPRISLCSAIDFRSGKLRSVLLIPVKVTFHDPVKPYIVSVSVESLKSKWFSAKQLIADSSVIGDHLERFLSQHGEALLRGFHVWFREAGGTLESGEHTYQEDLEMEDRWRVRFSVHFNITVRTFVNNNVLLRAKGIFDHSTQRLERGTLGSITLDQSIIEKSWSEVAPDFPNVPGRHNYRRRAFYSEDGIGNEIRDLISEIRNRSG